MIDAVEWNPKHHGHKPHYWKPDMEASLDNKNFIRQEPGQDWAWIAGSTYYVPYEAVHGVRREVVEGGADAGPVNPQDIIEALSAENERLREQLSGISGRLNVMREALIHTAGICNPASGFLKNATGVRKKHIKNVCDIALAALGDTK